MSYLENPMLDDDLTQSVRELQVPIFILQGRNDLQTVFGVTAAYYEMLRAPRKEFITFEESAHLVPYEEPEKFLEILVDRVRPLARDVASLNSTVRSKGSTRGWDENSAHSLEMH